MPINKQFSDDLVAGAAIRDGEGNIISSSYERLENKVTTLSSESTDTEYPSAKLMYDQLALKLNRSGGTITKLTVSGALKIGANMNANNKRIYGVATPTSTSDATNKAYVDAADALAEKLENKVDTIDSTSTTIQYPSAKCVYDNLTTLSNSISAISTSLTGKEDTSNKVTTLSSANTDTEYPSAAAVYTYGQTMKDDIVTVLTSSAHLYQLEPGLYKTKGSYTSIYFNGTDSFDFVDNSCFLVNDDVSCRSFHYMYNYTQSNKEYVNLVYVWQSTANSALGGADEWSTEVSRDSSGFSMSNLEKQENKVTTLSSSNTDKEYPSAKCVYDLIGDINTILATLVNVGGGS